MKSQGMHFKPAIHPFHDQKRPILWFIIKQNKLLIVPENGTSRLPGRLDIATHGINPVHQLFFGYFGDSLCYAGTVNVNDCVPDAWAWMDLRTLLGTIGDDIFWMAGQANHLLDWDQAHQYCGRCGHAMENKSDERAKFCPACGLINYPRLSPAVIMAIIKDGQILLARNKRFKIPMYSVLAGFVEPGETLEQCVRREISEEVNLTVKNIRYFGSQPWPFPNSLMVGFVADYAEGTIQVDKAELIEADWFSADALPTHLPAGISIAWQLIDWFVKQQGLKRPMDPHRS